MPLITVSHFFDFNAGIRPGNAVFTAFAEVPRCAAIAFAMSTSKPKMAPLDLVSSIGGEGGSVPEVNVPPGAAPGGAPPPAGPGPPPPTPRPGRSALLSP